MYFIFVVIIGVLLFAVGLMDLKSKTISRGNILLLMFMCFVGALIRVFADKEYGLWEIAGGVLIGACAIGLSMISREQIGRGDGFVIVAIGLILGFRKCLFAVCAASIIMTLVSVFVLILKKGNRKTKLPFIPALFAGYVMCITMAG